MKLSDGIEPIKKAFKELDKSRPTTSGTWVNAIQIGDPLDGGALLAPGQYMVNGCCETTRAETECRVVIGNKSEHYFACNEPYTFWADEPVRIFLQLRFRSPYGRPVMVQNASVSLEKQEEWN